MRGALNPGFSLAEIANVFQVAARFVYDEPVRILGRSFYKRHPSTVARQLLGKILVRQLDGVTLSGRIVETEAYSSDDPASHAYRGRTERNRALFGEPGHAYVYFTYGMHFCLNVVARRGKPAGGVLIRAVEPLEGIDEMKRRRHTVRLRDLMSGPGKVAQALAITQSLYGTDLTRCGALYIADTGASPLSAARTPRIGIRAGKDKLWRYVIKGSPFVSGPARPVLRPIPFSGRG
jgi:DNA-3-methyladenine glycosylase